MKNETLRRQAIELIKGLLDAWIETGEDKYKDMANDLWEVFKGL